MTLSTDAARTVEAAVLGSGIPPAIRSAWRLPTEPGCGNHFLTQQVDL
ncbi:MAG: hypothetical protein F6K09_14165 [Merismopedia sp. SIO2A8]|nr:hypothetical protein [Symploca sp. SIO2B6]NET49829.1 hypothetical protein [Merismopedia sp. SIO2A8]